MICAVEQSDAIGELLKLKGECKAVQVQKWRQQQPQPQQVENSKNDIKTSLNKPIANEKQLQDIQSNENFSIDDEEPSEMQLPQINNQAQQDLQDLQDLQEKAEVVDPEKAKIEKMIMGTQKEEDVDEQDIDEYLKNLEDN